MSVTANDRRTQSRPSSNQSTTGSESEHLLQQFAGIPSDSSPEKVTSFLLMTDVDLPVDTPTLTFDGGLPGFPDNHTFVLMNTELAQEPFSILRCVDDPELEFVVVPPALFFPDYTPEIDDATIGRIGLQSADEALLLVILTVGEKAVDITANLLGPIVVNQKTLQAAQAVLAGQDYDLRQPLFNESIRDVYAED